MLILICILQNKDNPAPVTVMDFCGESGLLAVGDQQGKVPPKIGFLTRRYLCDSDVDSFQ
jgi:hypothetical protein